MPKRAPRHYPMGRTPKQDAAIRKAEADDRRGSSTQRGYGYDWQQVRREHLQLEPLCRFCLGNSLVVAATVVDHIVTIREAPHMRLDHSNLRSLCKPCHDAHTAHTQGFAKKVRPA